MIYTSFLQSSILQQLWASCTGYININLPRFASLTSLSSSGMKWHFTKILGPGWMHTMPILYYSCVQDCEMYLFESSYSRAYLALYNIYRVLACLEQFLILQLKALYEIREHIWAMNALLVGVKPLHCVSPIMTLPVKSDGPGYFRGPEIHLEATGSLNYDTRVLSVACNTGNK